LTRGLTKPKHEKVRILRRTGVVMGVKVEENVRSTFKSSRERKVTKESSTEEGSDARSTEEEESWSREETVKGVGSEERMCYREV
jgi:hypothetical protein